MSFKDVLRLIKATNEVIIIPPSQLCNTGLAMVWLWVVVWAAYMNVTRHASFDFIPSLKFQKSLGHSGWMTLAPARATILRKSAHTALAVKACLLGGNSNTKCSMTFVNIAVAISALAGGGGQKRFRTETRIRWCFRHFSRIFGCLSARGYWNGILGHFGSFPAMEKRPKMKKTLYIARFCRVFGCQSIENCKNKCFGLTL